MRVNVRTILPTVWEFVVWGALAVIIANWFAGGFLHPVARMFLGDIVIIRIGMDIARWIDRRRATDLTRIDEAMASICYRSPDDENSVIVDHADVALAQDDGRLPPFFGVDAYFATPRIRDFLRASGRTLPVREPEV